MQVFHSPATVSSAFDDPNLVSSAGLVPVMGLAGATGLGELVDEHLSLPDYFGANAGLKITALVAGMAAGAGCIDDMALLRHGAMGSSSPASMPLQRWDRSCGRSPSATSASSRRQRPAGCRRWLRKRRSPPGLISWRWSISTIRSKRPMGTPSKAPATATPASKGLNALIGDRGHERDGPGDRRGAAAQGSGLLRVRGR